MKYIVKRGSTDKGTELAIQAVVSAFDGDIRLLLVSGGTGTGKSTLLGSAVNKAQESGKRIYHCNDSNLASNDCVTAGAIGKMDPALVVVDECRTP